MWRWGGVAGHVYWTGRYDMNTCTEERSWVLGEG